MSWKLECRDETCDKQGPGTPDFGNKVAANSTVRNEDVVFGKAVKSGPV